jgi:hypothetical protein
MRPLFLLGGLLACVPLTLSAQTKDRQFAQAPSVSRVIVMPLPSGRPDRDPQDRTVTQMPVQDDRTSPRGPDDTVTAVPPQSNPADQVPFDNSVTATPLPPAPPAEDQADAPVEVVPNPLDTATTPSVPGAGKQTQNQGQPVPGGWVKMGSATLQALDKVNAIGKTIVVKVGDTGRFASLDIAVRGCFVRPSDKPADATAFLVIRDQRAETPTPAFSGWMDRSAPYMSMMAHPLYDVRIAGCSP